jgi:type IV pilus assembly protein PilW
MKCQKGFTLPELLLAIAISGVIVGAVYSAFMAQKRSAQTTEEITAVQQNLRAAIYHMAREIRMAGYDPLKSFSAGFHNIADTTTLQLSWDGSRTEESPDGKLDPDENIYYQQRATDNTLRRGRGSPTGTVKYYTIAENITGLSWAFLDATGGPPSSEEDVRSVEITLSASLGGHRRVLTTLVLCRNMGL